MTEPDLSRAVWHKSSYSSQDGNCVEVAVNLPGVVVVRDSKDADGARLLISHAAWAVLVRELKNEDLEGYSRLSPEVQADNC